MREKKHPKAFICHSSADKDRFVRPLATTLLGLGIDAWVDEWEINPGDKFAEKIHNAIAQADAMVVILSENSIESRWVKKEMDTGLVREVTENMRLIPVVLDGLSGERIPPALRSIQQVRVSDCDHAFAAEEINRAIRGLSNPRKPLLGSSAEPMSASEIPGKPLPSFSLADLRQMASGDAVAQFYLGVAYVKGEGVPKNHAEAVKWFRHAAEQKLAQAQFNLGVAYHFGKSVPQDYAEAAKWFRRAAKQGYTEAQFNLGQMYRKGEGVPQDYAESAKWYHHAAEQGYAEAQFNLGAAYANGEGVPQDNTEAAKWFRLAAEQGLAEAQSNLGWAYGKGEGVPQDDEEAVKWVRCAAEQGFAPAKDVLREMGKSSGKE